MISVAAIPLTPLHRTHVARKGRRQGSELARVSQYCSDMRLAGHADWRMATPDELESFVDGSVHAPQRVGDTEIVFFGVGGSSYKRGNPYLTGNHGAATSRSIASVIRAVMARSSTSEHRNHHTTFSFFATLSEYCVSGDP